MSEAMAQTMFESGEEALKWAVEVLRRRRLPKTSPLWREIEAEAEWVEQVWEGGKNLTLPQDAEGRMHVALQVMEALVTVADRNMVAGRVVQLWAMGDWADEGRLRAALAMQEKCRREGVRVRLSYRYSYAQLGEMLGCDRKAAWRKVQDGLALLGEELAGRGLVPVVGDAAKVPDNFKKLVYFHEFKNDNE